MKEMINSLINELKKEIEKEKINNKEDLLKRALTEIKFFQHERFIHLIVTFFVGISAIVSLGFSVVTENIGLLLLFIVLFILFIPYIFYYYYLENSIQLLYKLYLEVKEK